MLRKFAVKVFGSTTFMLLWCVVVVPSFTVLIGYWMIEAGIADRWGSFFLFIPGLVMNVYDNVRGFYLLRREWHQWREEREMKHYLRSKGLDADAIKRGPDFTIQCVPEEQEEYERDPDAFIRNKVLANPGAYPPELIKAIQEGTGEFEQL